MIVIYQGKRTSSSSKLLVLFAVLCVLLATFCVLLSVKLSGVKQEQASLMQEKNELSEENKTLAETVSELEEKVGSFPAPSDGGDDDSPGGTAGLDYQLLYPDLKADLPAAFVEPPGKTVYLTFDDGPSPVTTRVLNALDQYDAKATFFVVGTNIPGNEAILKDIVDRGHTIAVHCQSHVYTDIYASVDAYLEDFNTVYEQIVEITGVKPTLFRFPGGSVNFYSKLLYKQIIAEMIRRGFLYYDWNVDSTDASANSVSADKIIARVKNDIRSDYSVVLMHDAHGKKTTADALPTILKDLSAAGYVFKALDNTVSPPSFSYNS